MPDILLRKIPFLKPDEQTIRALVYSVRCVALGAPAGVCHSKRWSWCDPRQDHRFYSFKMQQEAPILGASCCVKKENAALYWPR